MTAKQCYTAGIYCRLSMDDDTQGDSTSIVTQRQILEKYVRENGWIIGKVYVDDGYSGTTYERPGFKDMIADIEDGKIDLVLTKDLSRLGRNYVQTGFYTDCFFPEKGVRYIALNDNFDSLRDDNDLAPFRNIMNEWYSRDQSKKLRQSFRNKAVNGKCLASHPPMGYIYADDDKSQYVIDAQYAPVIRQMYEWSAHGMGYIMICRELFNQKIPCPTAVINERFGAFDMIFRDASEQRRYEWYPGQVKKILTSDVYLGTLTSLTKSCASYKNKKYIKRPPEEWVVLENAHEPIVTRELFDTVQKKIASRRRPGKQGEVCIFAGLVKCFECRQTMRFTTRKIRGKKEPKTEPYLNCNTYIKFGKTHCTSHYLGRGGFEMVLRQSLKDCIDNVLLDEQGLIDRIVEQNSFAGRGYRKAKERELEKALKRLSELDALFARLYEDMVANRLNERNYEMLSARYQTEQAELCVKRDGIKKELSQTVQTEDDVRKWVKLIKKYKDFEELDRDMLNELLDVIYIHKPETIDGQRTIQIDIHYNFVGKVN